MRVCARQVATVILTSGARSNQTPCSSETSASTRGLGMWLGTRTRTFSTLLTKLRTPCESSRRVFPVPNYVLAMAMGFSALRSRFARAVTIRCHRDKETMVIRRERHHPQPREIRLTFEATRLSLSWIAQASEHVVPLVRRRPSRLSRRSQEDAEELQRRWHQGPPPWIGKRQHPG